VAEVAAPAEQVTAKFADHPRQGSSPVAFGQFADQGQRTLSGIDCKDFG